LQYHPENSYLCRALPHAFQKADHEFFVLHVTPVTPSLKPKLSQLSEDGNDVVVTTAAHNVEEFVGQLGEIEGVELKVNQPPEQMGRFLRVYARVSLEGQAALVQNPLVVSIEKFTPVIPEDEVAGLIIAGEVNSSGMPLHDYMRWLQDRGVTGRGVTIGVVDEGVDTTHPAFKGRIVDMSAGLRSWHGTFVAG